MNTVDAKSNHYWNGSDGRLWLNNRDWDRLKSFSVSMSMEYEDVPIGYSKERALLGYEYTGSFSYRKTDDNYNNVLDLVFKQVIEGRLPEVSIIGVAENKATGKRQRIKVSGITFDEISLQEWEERSLVEEELSFQASKVEILEQ